MRWTLRLLARDPPGNYARLFKKQWQYKSKQVIKEQQILPELAALLSRENQKIVDPVAEERERIARSERSYNDPLSRLADYFHKPTAALQTGPPVYYYSMDEPLTCGLQQAALLTKSIVMHNPPKAFVDAYNKVELPSDSVSISTLQTYRSFSS